MTPACATIYAMPISRPPNQPLSGWLPKLSRQVLGWLLGGALLAGLVVYFWQPLQHVLTLDFIQQSQHDFAAHYAAAPWETRLEFVAALIASSTLAIPGTVLFCLAAGATFGIAWGITLVSFGTAIGATLAFWSARFLWRKPVQNHFGHRLVTINRGIQRRGGWYLFSLRLTPVIPFFAINLMLGLSHMRSRQFYAVTQLGMLAPIAVYVSAGRQLSRLQHLSDALDLRWLIGFVLLAVAPALVARGLRKLQARKLTLAAASCD